MNWLAIQSELGFDALDRGIQFHDATMVNKVHTKIKTLAARLWCYPSLLRFSVSELGHTSWNHACTLARSQNCLNLSSRLSPRLEHHDLKHFATSKILSSDPLYQNASILMSTAVLFRHVGSRLSHRADDRAALSFATFLLSDADAEAFA